MWLLNSWTIRSCLTLAIQPVSLATESLIQTIHNVTMYTSNTFNTTVRLLRENIPKEKLWRLMQRLLLQA